MQTPAVSVIFSGSFDYKSLTYSTDFTLLFPYGIYDTDTQVFLMFLNAPITITRLKVSLDSAGNNVQGDLMYADAFIGLANSQVINDFDTTAGVRDDSTITNASVPINKVMYLQFDSQPALAITQMHVHLEWRFT